MSVRHRRLLAALAAGILILALGAPRLAPYDAWSAQGSSLASPTIAHVLGLDWYGRDVLSRLLDGAPATVQGAVAASACALALGLILAAGALAPGWISALTRTISRAAAALPPLLIALCVLTLAGQGSAQVALATGLSLVGAAAIFTRVLVVSAQHQPYVEAAQALGAGRWHLLLWHIAPAISRLLLRYAVVLFSTALIANATLQFLGFGAGPGATEWGALLADGRLVFRQAPWVVLAPGLALTVLVWLANMLAERLAGSDLI